MMYFYKADYDIEATMWINNITQIPAFPSFVQGSNYEKFMGINLYSDNGVAIKTAYMFNGDNGITYFSSPTPITFTDAEGGF